MLELDFNTDINDGGRGDGLLSSSEGESGIRISEIALDGVGQENYRTILDVRRDDNLSPWEMKYDEYMKVTFTDENG